MPIGNRTNPIPMPMHALYRNRFPIRLWAVAFARYRSRLAVVHSASIIAPPSLPDTHAERHRRTRPGAEGDPMPTPPPPPTPPTTRPPPTPLPPSPTTPPPHTPTSAPPPTP